MPASACDSAPWYHAPVIVGGSGGSGTRGVVTLLENLGVHMACVSRPSLTDPAVCNLPCNPAADCGIINSFRGGDGLGWLRDNFSHVNDPCDVVDHAAVYESSNRSDADLCGGSKAAALHMLQHAVRPQFRHPLRWGMKNPHSTYYVNVLRAAFFPCLVYVNTVRDLDAMVTTTKHFSNRVQEAMRFGIIGEGAGMSLITSGEASRRQRLVNAIAMQAFYGRFLHDVNVGLDAWLQRCLPGRSVHIPLQRMVALTPHGPSCLYAIVRPLAHALKLDMPFVLNATRAFASTSLPLVRKSLAEGQAFALEHRHNASSARLWRWPDGSALEPRVCKGALVP